MDDRGRGSVELRCEAGELRVRVRDQGSGLSDEALLELFKPGYTTKAKGSGYGLFLALRMAREHGGDLSAWPASDPASSSTARGAIFELRLPVLRKPEAGPSADTA